MKLTKQQEEYLDSIPKMDDDQLLDELLDVNQPDDYDGCYTDYGATIREAVNKEMIKRLKDIDFLPNSYGV